jgi:pimeloyl-ACP methyl ester carboxylesterase
VIPPCGKIKRWFKWTTMALLGLLVVALVGSWLFEQIAEARDRRRFPPSGRLVQVGPIHLHAWMAGTNHSGPTVVFEAGLSATLDCWHHVAPAVAEFAPAVIYERAGVGSSEASPQPHDAVHTSEQLQQLLRELGAKPPFVLVGHSMGGLYVLGHAMQFPNAVAGAVLVDGSHPEQNKQPDPAESRLVKAVRFAAATAPFGTARLLLKAGRIPLPEDVFIRERYVAANSTRRHLQTIVREIEIWNTLTRQAASTNGLVEKPLIVLTAGTGHDMDWFELQRGLAALSSLGVQRTLTNATHISILDHPEHATAVASAIREVVEQSKKTTGR